MSTKFPGSFPVITETGLLFGYVFPMAAGMPVTEDGALRSPAERHPPEHGGPHTQHWTFAVADSGYVSPFRVSTRAGAVIALLAHCKVADPEQVAVVDLDLIGVLHGLAERYTRRQMARAAITYATARTRGELIDEPAEVAGRWSDPEPMDRALVRETVHALIGPSTADDVLAAYDKVAPSRFGLDTPFVRMLPPLAETVEPVEAGTA